MIGEAVLWALVAASGAHDANAGDLPACSNRVVRQTAERAGCLVGDARCWARRGGYCTDHVEAQLRARAPGPPARLSPVAPADVREGDVAVFVGRAHYAYVERVSRGADGVPVSVEVSEANYGTCWVDARAMVTDTYGRVTRRSVPVGAVDGGFLRLPGRP